MSFLTIVCFVWKKNSSSCSFLFSICLIDLSPFLYFEPMGVIVCKIDIFNSTYSWVLKKWTFSPFSFNTVSIFFFFKKKNLINSKPLIAIIPNLFSLSQQLIWKTTLNCGTSFSTSSYPSIRYFCFLRFTLKTSLSYSTNCIFFLIEGWYKRPNLETYGIH